MCAAARAIKLDCRTRIDVNRTRPSTVAMDWVTVSIISVFRNQQSMVTRRPVSQPGKAVGPWAVDAREKQGKNHGERSMERSGLQTRLENLLLASCTQGDTYPSINEDASAR